MLSNLKNIPTKVLCSAAFLLLVTAAILVLQPMLALAAVAAVALIYSVVTGLNYWIGHQ